MTDGVGAPRSDGASGAPGARLAIVVNGEARDVPAGTTVADLVAALGLRPEVVAVEVDRELVPRAVRATRALRAGERVELVTLVGGG